jgi:hypothetical protein
VSLVRHAVLAAGLGAMGLGGCACELVLTEHRSGVELQRLPLDAGAPELRIAFEHSVLGTTVIDRYRFTPIAHLVEERFDGQGYGLPHIAGPGESLQRDGDAWRLKLDRIVHPLVVRPLPKQHMRLLLGEREWLLAGFSAQAIEIEAQGCAAS